MWLGYNTLERPLQLKYWCWGYLFCQSQLGLALGFNGLKVEIACLHGHDGSRGAKHVSGGILTLVGGLKHC